MHTVDSTHHFEIQLQRHAGQPPITCRTSSSMLDGVRPGEKVLFWMSYSTPHS